MLNKIQHNLFPGIDFWDFDVPISDSFYIKTIIGIFKIIFS